MDPQPFVRVSVGQLGLKLPAGSKAATRLCDCEIRLGGFPAQTARVPLIHSPEFHTLDPFTNAAVFSLGEPDLRALLAPPGLLLFRRAPRPCLEVAVYLSGGGAPRCWWSSSRRRLVGVFRVELAPEWREWQEGKPVLLHHGWAGIGGKGGAAAAELHLRVKMEADPRYIFQFDDEVALSPQVVQLHGRFHQPIFSCKFIRDRRPSQSDALLGGQYWPSSAGGGGEEDDAEMAAAMRRKERKGWKVVIHDLSGSAVAAAFMATPFVPAPGGDTVARSNPGAWLIVRAAGAGTMGSSSDSWQPWGRLEAWRESPSTSSAAPPAPASSRDTVRLRLHLLPDGHDDCVLVSEAPLGSEKGGEFAIDMDRQAPPPPPEEEQYCAARLGGACAGGGFVMSCRVEGEARSSRPVVQLAARHVACMEDAAMFVALAAAVDLSVKACRPFPPKKTSGKKAASSSPAQPDPLELDT
ncbi:unnamed protein product [Urochloa decumbens]|uniref:Uncharacterized protein n=1 Tax=Urochloa decumbens TaxID=240449 RepID=A0ABC9BB47_9POAL